MCGRFDITLPAEALGRLFGVRVTANLPARYNLAPTQDAPVCRLFQNAREVMPLHWGLVPHWAKDAAIGSRMINARAETVADKPAFRDAFRSQRCLVPATGFFEWKAEGKRKQPYRILRADDQPLVFAGLWARWRQGETRLDSFTIITRDAVGPITALHHRMPAILPESDWDAWLNAETDRATALRLLATPPPDLRYYPVTARMGAPGYDRPEAIQPLDPMAQPDEPLRLL